jgi:hypothetical protein
MFDRILQSIKLLEWGMVALRGVHAHLKRNDLALDAPSSYALAQRDDTLARHSRNLQSCMGKIVEGCHGRHSILTLLTVVA